VAHQLLALTILDGAFIKFTTGEVAEQMIGGFLTAAEIEELLLDGRFSGDVGWVGPNGKPSSRTQPSCMTLRTGSHSLRLHPWMIDSASAWKPSPQRPEGPGDNGDSHPLRHPLEG
jgi:hypothetical protein